MICFRPVTAEDVPMLTEWIARPHWQQWWGDPETEIGYIRDMIFARDTTQPYVFQIAGEDKGYIQVWFVGDQQRTDWIQEYPWLELLPKEAVGVDLSLANAEDLSKGLGPRVLSAFVEKLRREGHARVLIDPASSNIQAIKAYRKAGFREIPELRGRTGDCLLMEHIETEGVS